MGTIGIFTTDKDLKITTWDDWLEVATGIKKSEVKNKALETIIPDFEKRNIKKRFLNVLENGVVEVLSPVFHHCIIDCKPLKPSNIFEKMQQRVTVAPLKENETIVGTIVTIEDLTEKMERERQFSEKLKSQNEAERLSAVQFFVQEEKVENKGIFKDILKDDSWRVRKVAVDALKSKTDLDIIATLIKSLKEEHNNINILNSALQILTMSEIDVADTLVNFLMSDDQELRQYAALALGEIKNNKTIPNLLRALKDDDINVRYHAIEALGKMKAKEAVSPILEILETRDFFLAFPAIDALVNIGDERVLSKLVELLDDELLSGPAIDALAVLGNEDAVPYLVCALDYVNISMVVSILKAIVSIYERYNEKYGAGDVIADIVKNRISKTGADKIVKSLDIASDESLHVIALILGWLEGDVIDKALIRILGKTSARKEIIDSIVRHGQHIINLLIDQINSNDIEIKKSAVIALGRIGDKRAAPGLISLLEDDPELAIISAGALAKIGDRNAFEALLKHIAHRDVGVRQAVISALNSIGHPDMAEKMLIFLKDKDPIVRESAVKIAGYFGYPECIELLIERCTDEAENVRYAAIQCLPFLEDKRVLSIIVNALKKDTPKVRAASAYALGQLEDEEAFFYLKDAVYDTDPWVRYFAAKAMGNCRNPEAIDVLSDILEKETAEHVRISAIESIGKIGGLKAVSVLSGFIKSKNFDVARTAIAGLGTIRHPDALKLLLSMTHSTDKLIKIETIKALGLIGGPEVINTLKWIAASEEDEDVASEAIESLSLTGSKDAVKALLELTSHKSRKSLCILKLSQLMDRYIAWVAEGLDHPNPHIRSVTIDILARMKHPDATEAIVRALDDKDTQVRLSAVNALSYLGSRYGEKKLSKMAIYDSNEMIRDAAKKVLMKIKGAS